jgi:hypothetical protein
MDLKAIAISGIEQGCDFEEGDSPDSIYSDAFDRAFDALIDAGVDQATARKVAQETAQLFAQP